MTETTLAIDINQTTAEELCQVPGVGKALAERLVASRPYASVDDLRRVPGVGDRFLERIRPYLCVTPPDGAMMSAEEAAAALAAADAQPESEPVDILLAPLPEEPADEAVELHVVETATVLTEPLPSPDGREDTLEVAPPVDAAPQVVPLVEAAAVTPTAPVVAPAAAPRADNRPARIEVLAYVLLGSFLALVLGVLITLGVLRAINGDLLYATTGRVTGLQAEITAVNAQVGALQGDVIAMRGRVEALEALGGRVSAVEREAQSLRGGLAAAESQLAEVEAQTQALAAQAEQLDARTTQLEQRTTVFQSFLDGLRSLLLGLPMDAK